MLQPRIIPCLLIQGGGLVKTTLFKNPIYIGDPINTVRIFNEKEVDELVILDIDATVKHNPPNLMLIEKLARNARMPLCYGGGIKTVEQAENIINLGIEKIALSSTALENPQLISAIANKVGAQSLVVILDIKKKRWSKGYEVYTHQGTKATGKSPVTLLLELQKLGVGEIIINAIDKDGLMSGYDFELIQAVQQVAKCPITALGGAGSLTDMAELFKQFGIMGAAAGSLFVFKGKYRAVLINYPSLIEREKLFTKSLSFKGK